MTSNKTDIVKIQKERHEFIMSKIDSLQKEHGLAFPKDYNYINAIQSAWLILQEVEDRNKNKALQVCTPNSIANFMLDMVTQGLSLSKKQCYAIVYGNKLTCVRSYFGTIAFLKRVKGFRNYVCEVIHEGDNFKIGMRNGEKVIETHHIEFQNLDKPIIGAYCAIYHDTGVHTEIMTIAQIKRSWQKSKMKNPVHTEFEEQMVKRTVINRAAKYFVNSSDDHDLVLNSFNKSNDENEELTPEEISSEIVEENANSVNFDLMQDPENKNIESNELELKEPSFDDPGF